MMQKRELNRACHKGRRIERRRRRARAMAVIAAFALAGIVSGGFGVAAQAGPNGQPAAGLDSSVAGPAIIAHLNAVIQFYRSVREPVQKAGEPNDAVYHDQAVTQASQAAELAFQSATAEAAVMETSPGQAAAEAGSSTSEEKLAASEAAEEKRISDLEAREAGLDRQIASASPRAAPGLEAQKQQVQAALELATALRDAMKRIMKASGAAGAGGLSDEIERLQRSAPDLESSSKTTGAPLTTIESALSAGVTTQAGVVFRLLGSLHTLSTLMQDNDRLHQQATDLRAPMLQILRGLIQQGEQLSEQAEAGPPLGQHGGPKGRGAAASLPAGPAPEDLQVITAKFKALSQATVPLSEEIIVLEQSHANLAAWQSSVDQEYDSILHALLLRILVIAIALGIIIGAGEAWTRATNKYIRDLRRRRQLLIVRRVVVGFLSALVILFGFVTQFNSLATFAGFLTAGVALGLQTILLSVAAYFFIIGRFGIRVGDRITIAGVTGDVIEVGLVRFYVMELAGTGTTLHPTGRVAVFSNAVLFQAGTPLYKQLPGTGYAWHELTVKLADGADYREVCDAILQPVRAVYEEYRATIEAQHQSVQNWMQAAIEAPVIESRLQFSGSAFQLWARIPVEIALAAETDEKITHALLELMAADPAIKAAVTATPSIEPSVRG